MHNPSEHLKLAPQDLPHHIREHHGTDPAQTWVDGVDDWFRIHGVESTGDPELDKLTVWHDLAHEDDEEQS